MNPPQVYICSPSWTLLPPSSPYHPSGSSQCTSPKHPVSCIEPGLAIRFIHDILHVSMPFSQIFPPSLSPYLSDFYAWPSSLIETGEPGGLPSMGLHGVGHDWCDLAAAAAAGLGEGGLPLWLSCKESTCNIEDTDSIPGSGMFAGGGIGTHSSVLTWRIPWTEEPGRLQSMGSQRAGHDWATSPPPPGLGGGVANGLGEDRTQGGGAAWGGSTGLKFKS